MRKRQTAIYLTQIESLRKSILFFQTLYIFSTKIERSKSAPTFQAKFKISPATEKAFKRLVK